jgi:CBS domain-containing protein
MTTCGELMTPSPSCCRGDITIDQAAELMKRDDVGLIPVVSDASAKLIGVITDRDIAVKVVAGHRDPRMTTVGEVMTPDPIFCRPQESAEALMELMASNQIRRVPIVDDVGAIIGIVAQADLATRLGRPEETAQVVEAISEGQNGTTRTFL